MVKRSQVTGVVKRSCHRCGEKVTGHWYGGKGSGHWCGERVKRLVGSDPGSHLLAGCGGRLGVCTE